MDFVIPKDHIVKLKESKKKDKYLDLSRELTKLWNIKVIVVPVIIGTLGTVTKGLLQGLEDLEITGRVGDHLNYSIIEINQNTEKSPGELRRCAVTQTPVKDHQLTLMWKTLPDLKTRPYNNQQKKKKKENLQSCRLCCPGRPQNKTERIWKER